MLRIVIETLLIYFIAQTVWGLFRSGKRPTTRAGGRRANATPKQRFDTHNRDVADAEFEELDT